MSAEDETSGLVSVVIPTYNRPGYLGGAIETALEQTYDKIEVIVVDDGSEDPYAKENVSEHPEFVNCVCHEENQGLSAARNTGIRNSNGEFVAFLDDDDRWHKTKIARQVSALEENEDAGLATCLVAAITPNNEIVHCEANAPNGDCSESMLIGNQIGTPSRVLVRRECFNEVGTFDESLPTKQDWDFYLRLCQEWNVAAVEDHLCFRTVHDSMSSSPASALRDNMTILEKNENLLRSRGYWKQARAEIEERVGRAYLRQMDLKLGREHFREALDKNATLSRRLLYLLTFTHPAVVEKMRTMKRSVLLRTRDCSKQELLDDVVFDGTSGGDNGND